MCVAYFSINTSPLKSKTLTSCPDSGSTVDCFHGYTCDNHMFLLQMEMLRGAVLMLHAQCDQCLTKVERIFPANSYEGIGDSKEGIGKMIIVVDCTQQLSLLTIIFFLIICC